jgi:hypothetical protein
MKILIPLLHYPVCNIAGFDVAVYIGERTQTGTFVLQINEGGTAVTHSGHKLYTSE